LAQGEQEISSAKEIPLAAAAFTAIWLGHGLGYARFGEKKLPARHPGCGLNVPDSGSSDAPYVAPDAPDGHRS